MMTVTEWRNDEWASHIAIYDRALTADEMRQIHEGARPDTVATDALVSYWVNDVDPLLARLAESECNARLFGVRWAIDQGYIGRDYADDALRAAGSDKC